MGMRVGVLCSRIRVEEKLLFEALTARGVEYEKLDDRTLVFNLHDPKAYQQYDVILERSINHSRALYALQCLTTGASRRSTQPRGAHLRRQIPHHPGAH